MFGLSVIAMAVFMPAVAWTRDRNNSKHLFSATSTLIGATCRRTHFRTVQGPGQIPGIIKASVGALPPGIASDLFGTYDYGLGIVAVIPPVCASVAIFPTTPEISETEMKRYGKT